MDGQPLRVPAGIDSALQSVPSRAFSFTGDGWTIPVLCLGLALLACAVLVPATDANRRLAYEREALRLDLASLQEQLRVNHDFLQRVATDPSLAERLAQRQMKLIREGSSVLPLRGQGATPISPFLLVNVPRPATMAPYQPVDGKLAEWCRNTQSRMLVNLVGLACVGLGLLTGAGVIPKPLAQA